MHLAVRNIKFPVQDGIPLDWNIYESFLSHTFLNELRVAPEETNVFMLDHPLVDSPTQMRRREAQILFESLCVPSISLADTARAALKLTERDTGIILDIGEHSARIVPIVKGKLIRDNAKHLPIGGRDLTDRFYALMHERFSMTGGSEREVPRRMKETTCFVALDFDEAMRETKLGNKHEMHYEESDGSAHTLISERFRCPEILFSPSMVNVDGAGLSQLLADCINSFDGPLAEELASNITLAGASSSFPGLAERLSLDVSRLVSASLAKNMRISKAPCDPKHAAFLGAASWSAQPDFLWVTTEQYNEQGLDATIAQFM
jgi:actin